MSFSLEVKMWCQQAAEGLNEARAAALLDIGTSIINDTPVKTGLAKGNWQSSVNEPKTERLSIRPASDAIAELVAVLAQLKDDETFIMRNNLPYATPLEFGHSQQAPAGMVRANVKRWNAAVERAALHVRDT